MNHACRGRRESRASLWRMGQTHDLLNFVKLWNGDLAALARMKVSRGW